MLAGRINLGLVRSDKCVKPNYHRLVVALICMNCAGASVRPKGDVPASLKNWQYKVSTATRLPMLDADADGRLSVQDARWFAWINEQADKAIAASRLEGTFAPEAYAGRSKSEEHVLAALEWSNGRPSLPKEDAQRLHELSVESKWLAGQSLLASLKTESATDLDGDFFSTLRHSLSGYNEQEMSPQDVCTALDQFDTEPFIRASVPLTAILDLDSTVWWGNISDGFLDLMLERRTFLEGSSTKLKTVLGKLEDVSEAQIALQDVHTNVRLLLDRSTNRSLPKPQRISPADTFYTIVSLLEGLKVEDVRQVAHDAYTTGSANYGPWLNRIYSDESQCTPKILIEKLHQKGFEVYLLSAAIDFLAQVGAHYLGVPVNRVMGSRLGVIDGRYTGKVTQSTYYTKRAIVRAWLPAPPLFVVGDSARSDFPMLLEAAVAGFCINTSSSLAKRDKHEAGGLLVDVFYKGSVGNPMHPPIIHKPSKKESMP
jgi:phosphoserine phosphatase